MKPEIQDAAKMLEVVQRQEEALQFERFTFEDG